MICTLQMSQNVEMVSNIQLKKFGLNVRRYGPQPSISVRSFGQITSGQSNGIESKTGRREEEGQPSREKRAWDSCGAASWSEKKEAIGCQDGVKLSPTRARR